MRRVGIVLHGVKPDYIEYRTFGEVGEKSEVIKDIRLNLALADLEFKNGHLIQFTQDSLWVSRIMLALDGNGARMAFVAFSICFSKDCYVAGAKLCEVSDYLVKEYSKQMRDGCINLTDSLDCAFVEMALSRLKADLQSIKFQFDYNGGEDFAYVNVAPGKTIADYLDNPFWDEYADYRGVFIGNELIASGVNATHLNIDLDNVEYTIRISGEFDSAKIKETGESINNNGKIALKKLLGYVGKTIIFEKKYRMPKEIVLKEDSISKGDRIVRLQCPGLDKEKRQINISVKNPTAKIDDIICSDYGVNKIDAAKLEVVGDAIGETHKITIKATGYADCQATIENDFADNSTLSVELMVKISVELSGSVADMPLMFKLKLNGTEIRTDSIGKAEVSEAQANVFRNNPQIELYGENKDYYTLVDKLTLKPGSNNKYVQKVKVNRQEIELVFVGSQDKHNIQGQLTLCCGSQEENLKSSDGGKKRSFYYKTQDKDKISPDRYSLKLESKEFELDGPLFKKDGSNTWYQNIKVKENRGGGAGSTGGKDKPDLKHGGNKKKRKVIIISIITGIVLALAIVVIFWWFWGRDNTENDLGVEFREMVKTYWTADSIGAYVQKIDSVDCSDKDSLKKVFDFNAQCRKCLDERCITKSTDACNTTLNDLLNDLAASDYLAGNYTLLKDTVVKYKDYFNGVVFKSSETIASLTVVDIRQRYEKLLSDIDNIRSIGNAVKTDTDWTEGNLSKYDEQLKAIDSIGQVTDSCFDIIDFNFKCRRAVDNKAISKNNNGYTNLKELLEDSNAKEYLGNDRYNDLAKIVANKDNFWSLYKSSDVDKMKIIPISIIVEKTSEKKEVVATEKTSNPVPEKASSSHTGQGNGAQASNASSQPKPSAGVEYMTSAKIFSKIKTRSQCSELNTKITAGEVTCSDEDKEMVYELSRCDAQKYINTYNTPGAKTLKDFYNKMKEQ